MRGSLCPAEGRAVAQSLNASISRYFFSCQTSFFSASNAPIRRSAEASLGKMRITRSRLLISSQHFRNLILLVTLRRFFTHRQIQGSYERSQRDNDYPFHYTSSSSFMRLYARRLMMRIMAARPNVTTKPVPTKTRLATQPNKIKGARQLLTPFLTPFIRPVGASPRGCHAICHQFSNTGTGVKRSVVVPSPIWPGPLWPQQFTVPPASRAQV